MARLSPVLTAMLLLLPTAAQAQNNITLPLSHGAFASPRLATVRLTAATRKTVIPALDAATKATHAAMAAETIIRAAMIAGDKAGKVRGYDTLDVPGDDGRACLYQGRTLEGHATGLGVMHCRTQLFMGYFRGGRLTGLGGDTALDTSDAYEGEYRNGTRMGFGIERDKDGFYPGLYGLSGAAGGQKTDMELLGLQNFKEAHWAGHYGLYHGPKVACSLIKGAVLEGSVLDGYGAKFDAGGRLIEQGFYKSGVPVNGGGPPC